MAPSFPFRLAVRSSLEWMVSLNAFPLEFVSLSLSLCSVLSLECLRFGFVSRFLDVSNHLFVALFLNENVFLIRVCGVCLFMSVSRIFV
jgi:hypothetical protein